MDKLHVAIGQLVPKLGDKQVNVDQLEQAMVKAKESGANTLVLPELYLTGYSIGPQVEEMAETTDGQYMTMVRQLCATHKMHLVISYPEAGEDDHYYISSAWIDAQGEVLGNYRKTHLFDTEKDYFTPGDAFTLVDTPFGKAGLMICFDVEFPEIARALKLMGAAFIIIVNANMHPYETHHHIFARARAMENELPIIICNRLGVEDKLDFCGDSMAIAADGEILLALQDKEAVQTTVVPVAPKLDPKMSYTVNRRKDLYNILTDK